jgi:hypothetical protein
VLDRAGSGWRLAAVVLAVAFFFIPFCALADHTTGSPPGGCSCEAAS